MSHYREIADAQFAQQHGDAAMPRELPPIKVGPVVWGEVMVSGGTETGIARAIAAYLADPANRETILAHVAAAQEAKE